MPLRPATDPAKPVIVLFRHDLRLRDNLALSAAAETGKPVVAAFVGDESPAVRRPGAARRWWLHHSLSALSEALAGCGVRLLLRRGTMAAAAELVAESGADLVLWNRRYQPAAAAADAAMAADLAAGGIARQDFDGHLLHDPAVLRTGAGEPFKLFTPFWRALTDRVHLRDPADAPSALRPFGKRLASERLADWALLPTGPDWSGGLADTWTPGEAGAEARLERFLEEALDGYAEGREVPGRDATSRLSPHLAHGEITPTRVLSALRRHRRGGRDADSFRRELGWREFCWHLLAAHPNLAGTNVKPAFDAMPWRRAGKELAAWQRGMTGYPIVDAGMRQLWQTGFMHNRVRMVVASFLIKHLLIDWREGERWFWDTLVDADPADNPGNWQWVAGSGADAAPFFRVFNPILQGSKFDPEGSYVRRYVPELARLDNGWIHRPFEAPAPVLAEAGVRLGSDYPHPLIAHPAARQRALTAFGAVKRG